mmetsp:Transcript_66290/g.176855  ORF Transcript_66290/g.176855 Transcript_66290/m.176855 type:complete len:700 (+) Transcript_66290:31-2130(+)
MEVFEEVVGRYPTSAKYWKKYAEWEIASGRYDLALQVFHRCVFHVLNVDLWKLYVLFMVTWRPLHEALAAYEAAIELVGQDVRSTTLWTDFIAILKRWHNARARDVKRERVVSGQIAPLVRAEACEALRRLETQAAAESVRETVGTGPQSDKAVEEAVKSMTSEDKSKLLDAKLSALDLPAAEKVGGVDPELIRSAYVRAVCTPLDDIVSVWAGWGNFEADFSNKGLAAKVMAQFQPRYEAARKVAGELQKLYDGLDTTQPALPVKAMTTTMAQNLRKKWNTILLYEKSNPLAFPPNNLGARVAFVYQQCLLQCGYHVDFGFGFCTWLDQTGQQAEALQVLEVVVRRYAPKDVLLRLTLAQIHEERSDGDAAAAEYESILADSVDLCPLALIHLLRLLRRTKPDPGHARKRFLEAVGTKHCTWEVFVAFARSEWHDFGCRATAEGIIKQAVSLFGKVETRVHVAYSEFLMLVNDVAEARRVLSTAVQQFSPSTRPEDYGFLLGRAEHLEERYGTTDSVRALAPYRARLEALQNGTVLNKQAKLFAGGASYETLQKRFAVVGVKPPSGCDKPETVEQANDEEVEMPDFSNSNEPAKPRDLGMLHRLAAQKVVPQGLVNLMAVLPFWPGKVEQQYVDYFLQVLLGAKLPQVSIDLNQAAGALRRRRGLHLNPAMSIGMEEEAAEPAPKKAKTEVIPAVSVP